jgi:DNA invertase Pin-like site-specific DNA recombinase
MNAGYVRLSRDDDKRNYVSIENQKLIINQYAADHGMVIDRWYEDAVKRHFDEKVLSGYKYADDGGSG